MDGARIAVLTGGSTPERMVALAGARQVVAALRGQGCRVTVFDTASPKALDQSAERRLLVDSVGRRPPSLAELRALQAREDVHALLTHGGLGRHDAVFLVLHGRQGEGGEIQELLEGSGLAFTGSGSAASSLAMDKTASKARIRVAGVPVPSGAVWPVGRAETEALGLPLVVKPSRVGSTVGLTLLRDLREVDAAVGRALQFDDEVLIEEFLPGREYTVGVLDGQALGVGEIVPPGEIFDYRAKYTPGLAREVFPARIADDLAERLRTFALAAHRALGLRDVSRVDFRLDRAGEPRCLEVNTLPGMTETSLLPQSAAVCGISFAELCERMVRLALSRTGPRPVDAVAPSAPTSHLPDRRLG